MLVLTKRRLREATDAAIEQRIKDMQDAHAKRMLGLYEELDKHKGYSKKIENTLKKRKEYQRELEAKIKKAEETGELPEDQDTLSLCSLSRLVG